MATKTLTASVDPDLYRRARQAARATGQAQSTVVAEALSLYVALPTDVRAVLRGLPPEAAAHALRTALARGLWDDAVDRWRAALPVATRRRLAKLSDDEVMARAIREVAGARRPKR
jgi:predicted transcriptional regulator